MQSSSHIQRLPNSTSKDYRSNPLRVRDTAQKFDVMSRSNDETRTTFPPLPPPPPLIPSVSSSSESVSHEPSSHPAAPDKRPFAKPPGPRRKKVTGLDNPQISNVSALTFPKKQRRSPSPPPIPPKTLQRSTGREYPTDENDSFDIYEDHERIETELFPVVPKQTQPSTSSPYQNRRIKQPIGHQHRQRRDDDSPVLRTVNSFRSMNSSISFD